MQEASILECLPNRAHHPLFARWRLFNTAASFGLYASAALGFGTILGFSLGCFARTFRLEQEKGLLLKELNRRAKNNLSVIKSMTQIQRKRSRDPEAPTRTPGSDSE